MLLVAIIAVLIMGYIAGGTAALKNRSAGRWGIPLGCAFGIFVLAAIMVPSRSSRTASIIVAVVSGLSLAGCLGGLIALSLQKALCPQCRQPLSTRQWKDKTCPQCGSFAKGRKKTQTTGLDALVIVAGIILTFVSFRFLLFSPVSDPLAIALCFAPLAGAVGFAAYRALRRRH